MKINKELNVAVEALKLQVGKKKKKKEENRPTAKKKEETDAFVRFMMGF